MHERLKMIYCSIMSYVYVPYSIKNIREKKLLHISDTPVLFYNVLSRLLKELSPSIIIHTGDLVDNIKIGIYKGQLPRYEYHLKSIMHILEASDAEQIYICAGNHDDKDLMRKYSKRSSIIDESSSIEIFNMRATLSHFPYKIMESPAAYNFFGHDISIGNDMINNKVYLNGIQSINILTDETKRLFCLPYPYGINDERLMKKKIGL